MRVKLQFPEPVIFSCELPVRITDLNYGNHLGNDRLLSFAHEARVQWLLSLGYTEMNMAGSGLIMADAMIQFQGEAFYGDSLRVQLALKDIKPNSFDLYYQLSTLRQDQHERIALMKTAMVSYHYAQKKVSQFPESILTRLTRSMGQD